MVGTNQRIANVRPFVHGKSRRKGSARHREGLARIITVRSKSNRSLAITAAADRSKPMIPEEKMVQLAKALLEKTRNHEANWRPDPLYHLSYILQLPRSRIRVAMARMPDVPDRLPTFT